MRILGIIAGTVWTFCAILGGVYIFFIMGLCDSPYGCTNTVDDVFNSMFLWIPAASVVAGAIGGWGTGLNTKLRIALIVQPLIVVPAVWILLTYFMGSDFYTQRFL